MEVLVGGVKYGFLACIKILICGRKDDLDEKKGTLKWNFKLFETSKELLFHTFYY